ncbi:unnamed protein product, partial [Dibothriocephalus latus]
MPVEAIESLKTTNAQIQSTLAFLVQAVDDPPQQPSLLSKRQASAVSGTPRPQPSVHSLDRIVWSCLIIRQLLPGPTVVADLNSDAYFAPNLELSDSTVTGGLLRLLRTLANVWALILTNEEKVHAEWRNFLSADTPSAVDGGPGRLLPPFNDTVNFTDALNMMKGAFPLAAISPTAESPPSSHSSLADFCAELRLWIGLAEIALTSPSL